MRVLHVITGLQAGGAERQLRDLVAHHRVTAEVACLTGPGLMSRIIEAGGVRVHHLGMRNNRDLRVLASLWRLVRSGRYDVVHTHLFRASLYGRLIARPAGVPAIVASEHSIGEHVLEGRPITPAVRGLTRASERFGDMTIAVSSTAERRLRDWGVPAERIEVIPNGIDAGDFRFDPALRRVARDRLGIPAGATVVGAVGRLDPGKRFEVLIEALAGVPGAFLLLVGDGVLREALAAQARRLGLADRVILTGSSSRVPDLLSAMDLFASPSQEETFGLAIVEAMASGLPVLYSACPALDELPPDAAPDAHRVRSTAQDYRNGIDALLAQGLHRRPPSRAVDHYSITDHVRRIEALYERVHERRSHKKINKLVAGVPQ